MTINRLKPIHTEREKVVFPNGFQVITFSRNHTTPFPREPMIRGGVAGSLGLL